MTGRAVSSALALSASLRVVGVRVMVCVALLLARVETGIGGLELIDGHHAVPHLQHTECSSRHWRRVWTACELLYKYRRRSL
jgi:hypothetical protein